MYTKSAEFYDAVYSFKDYAGEVEKLEACIRQHKRSPGTQLLDVACGTGKHLSILRSKYTVEGLDIDETLLAIARERNPGVRFHHADMLEFDLGRCFDVVVCLFSSIGYTKTRPRLFQAVRAMRRHLHPGGLLVIEPWFVPGVYKPGSLHALMVDEPNLKIARMNVSGQEGEVSVIEFHYLVGKADGIEHFTERHELGLFSHEDYTQAMAAAGLTVIHDAQGLTGRGLYLGLG